MTRQARLASAKHWLSKYEGKNIIKGYSNWYGVDLICATAELKTLGVALDSDRIKQIERSVEDRQKEKQRIKQLKKKAELEKMLEDSDETFAYIAGYTSGEL